MRGMLARPWRGAGWLVLSVLAGVARAGGGPREVTPNRVDYRIEATVDTTLMRLAGHEYIRFENHTDAPTSELRLHLYWNAFANNRSTHLIGSNGELRGVDIEDGWGWQRVTSLKSGDTELASTFTYEHPDDGNADDRTVLRVALPVPIEPGATAQFEVTWEAQIPRCRRRCGYQGNFLFISQWFPKLGVFEGSRGWNCHQFHSNTEFFSDYGTYDVSIDLPGKYRGKVGSSGVVDNVEPHGDRVITHCSAPALDDRMRLDASGRAPLVHDFAWTADPDYQVRHFPFSFDAWKDKFETEITTSVRAFGGEKNIRLRNVDVQLLMQPEHADQWERHGKAACAALFFYGLWFGEYPYSQVTCVDPQWGSAAGGMEYPTLFTAGTSLWTTPEMHSPEFVTVHECGHQFWYGLVGNNEFEASWLDEGFNSYTDAEVMSRRFGLRSSTTDYSHVPFFGVAPVSAPGGGVLDNFLSARNIPLPWTSFALTPVRNSGFVNLWRDQPQLAFVEEFSDARWQQRGGYLGDPDRDQIDTPAFRYVDSRSYGVNSYRRTAVVLRSLVGVVGYEPFLRGMRHYSEQWRFRHPYAQDFFDSFCEGAGVDVHWYFEDLFRGTGTVDWSIDVQQQRESERKGVFQAGPADEFVALDQKKKEETPAKSEPADEHAPADAPKPSAAKHDEDSPWKARVLVVRHGDLRLPLTIELRYDDKSTERRTWSREDQAATHWLSIEVSGKKKLVAVVIDPERTYFIDTDMSNNSWFDATDRVAPWRWTERIFERYVHVLHWQAGLGG